MGERAVYFVGIKRKVEDNPEEGYWVDVRENPIGRVLDVVGEKRNCSRPAYGEEKAGFGAMVSVMAWRADLPLRRPVAMTEAAAA